MTPFTRRFTHAVRRIIFPISSSHESRNRAVLSGRGAFIGMLWILGCGSLVTARSSTLSAISNPASPHHPDYLEYQQGRLRKRN